MRKGGVDFGTLIPGFDSHRESIFAKTEGGSISSRERGLKACEPVKWMYGGIDPFGSFVQCRWPSVTTPSPLHTLQYAKCRELNIGIIVPQRHMLPATSCVLRGRFTIIL